MVDPVKDASSDVTTDQEGLQLPRALPKLRRGTAMPPSPCGRRIKRFQKY
jgi:hypothetical protein